MSVEKSDIQDQECDAVHAYFIGPKGSNLADFRGNINTILDEVLATRQSYYPGDQDFVTKEDRRSPAFLEARSNLRLAVEKLAQLLGEHSAPFSSPRYEAHMCTDLTMPSLLGYFMTMLYNPNNVTLEASPMTTLVELRVGQQMCKLFGYNIDPQKSPLGWGHITCGGTIANLESIWVARNLKFYPLSLCLALRHGKLRFIGDKFFARSCLHISDKTLFKDLSAWDLLNLRSDIILDLPSELNKQFGITSKFLENALKEFNIQTVGRQVLEREFQVKNPVKYFVSKTRHYSWPKGAAIAGLGSENVIGIDVDNAAQMDINILERHLERCVVTKTAVLAVVAIIGTTEEGAVDSLSEILRLRSRFQYEHGLSFLVHVDAAWGGYFATMINPSRRYNVEEKVGYTKPEPEWYLQPKTVEDIKAMAGADSITVDPHKAGYIPYPAGSLVYRDGRMRHLVTWSSPYLCQNSPDNIGVYGVEGSKPGASAMSVWLSHITIGLNNNGYGKLLGEASFTSARLSAHYATMINDDFICVPFNMLPAENKGDQPFLSQPVQEQRDKIHRLIIGKPDHEIFTSKEAMKIIRDLGSDLNINCFTLNWKYKNGELNTDLEEANYLMKRVINRLSISSANSDPTKIPIFLTSTQFLKEDYGSCAHKFMERMGVAKSNHALFVIRNVVMSPFPTRQTSITKLMSEFEEVIREEVNKCRMRNDPSPKEIQFLLQGSPAASEVFLSFQACFHSATKRRQIIISATLDDTFRSFYKKLVGDNHSSVIMLESSDKVFIDDIAEVLGDLDVIMYEKGAKKYALKGGKVTLKSVIKDRPLVSMHREVDYPSEFMPFYLYGNEKEMHCSHMLVTAPNIFLAANNITFDPALLSEINCPQSVSELLAKGLVLGLSEIPEVSVQPFVEKNQDLPEDFFFRHGQTFKVKIWKDPRDAKSYGPGLLDELGRHLYEGEMTLSGTVFVDVEGVNEDKLKQSNVECNSWQRKLDEVESLFHSKENVLKE